MLGHGALHSQKPITMRQAHAFRRLVALRRQGWRSCSMSAAPQQQLQPLPSTAAKRLYIIDTNAQAHRMHHGFGSARLADSVGSDTSVLNGFMATLVRLLEHEVAPPTHMAVVADAPGKTFRHELYPQYKAHRPPSTHNFKLGLGQVLRMVWAAGIPILSVPGVEADDVIGSLAVRAASEGYDVVIVSPDKDFYQLLGPRISIMRLVKSQQQPQQTQEQHQSPPPQQQQPQLQSQQPSRRSSAPLYTAADFAAEYDGLSPSLFADVRALMGDSSDNVPGVKGIGAKNALKLVSEFGDVESLLERAAEVSKKSSREMLLSEDGQNAARLAKVLVSVVTDLQVPEVRDTPLEAFKLKPPPDGGAELTALLQAHEMTFVARSMARVLKRWKLEAQGLG